MKKYTLAFIFTPSLEKVLLVHKLNPEWQRGKLNGIGGKIEEGEASLSGIIREIKEETDLNIVTNQCKHIGTLSADNWVTEVFTTIYEGLTEDAKTMEQEKIEWFNVDNLPTHMISNLIWLIPFSIDILKNPQLKSFLAKY